MVPLCHIYCNYHSYSLCTPFCNDLVNYELARLSNKFFTIISQSVCHCQSLTPLKVILQPTLIVPLGALLGLAQALSISYINS